MAPTRLGCPGVGHFQGIDHFLFCLAFVGFLCWLAFCLFVCLKTQTQTLIVTPFLGDQDPSCHGISTFLLLCLQTVHPSKTGFIRPNSTEAVVGLPPKGEVYFRVTLVSSHGLKPCYHWDQIRETFRTQFLV